MDRAREVFVTGGTGYMGRALCARLVERGHRVRALVRPGSGKRLAAGAEAVTGNALDASTFADQVREGETFVQLVGVAHPGPAKAAQFVSVDLASARAGIDAARSARAGHFVYVSVAHPAPVMRAYVQARLEAEAHLAASGLTATVLRPWYVLGPGHRWPLVLAPAYWILERVPVTREGARRLGLVTLAQMVAALVRAVEEEPPEGTRVLDVPAIREAASP
ncbi:MAG TPA: NAD(P)H-binding protein [Usitatibacter sp.]|nr:NAD(P)H-binding protein [Usitatibacter sp.]